MNSARFNDDSSDYLNKTLGTASNRKIFTWSEFWTKKIKYIQVVHNGNI